MCEKKQRIDTLEICGLEVSCIIGDLPSERIQMQTLMIDVALRIDLNNTARSDDLADTVDYAALCDDIRAVLLRSECRMIERAADCVACVALVDPRVKSVRVRVEKLGSVKGLRAAAVVIERDNI